MLYPLSYRGLWPRTPRPHQGFYADPPPVAERLTAPHPVSAYAMAAIALTENGHSGRAAGYVPGTNVVGIIAAVAGLALGRATTQRACGARAL